VQLHDFRLKGYSVSAAGTRVMLDLEYAYPNQPKEESLIEFADIAAYHFVHTGGAIITDIEEVPLADLLDEVGGQLAEWWRLHGGLRNVRRLFPRSHHRPRGIHLFFRLHQFESGDGALRFRRLLQPVVGGLRGGQLRLGLDAVGFGGLHFGFGFGNARRHFGRAQLHQQVPGLHGASAIHQHALHEARYLGVQRDLKEGQYLAGEIDRA